MKFAVGVNTTFVPEIAAVPPTAFATPVMVSAWPLSFAGPARSLPVRLAKLIVRAPEPATMLDRLSLTAVGASLTTAVSPGEPISAVSFFAANAAFTPTALNCEIVALLIPAALSKVANGPVGEAPKATLARRTLLLS